MVYHLLSDPIDGGQSEKDTPLICLSQITLGSNLEITLNNPPLNVISRFDPKSTFIISFVPCPGLTPQWFPQLNPSMLYSLNLT